MDKLNLIILAGGERGPLYDKYGVECKALLPIHGKAMLDWVVEAYHATGLINKIVVVGPEELDKLDCMKYVDKRVNPASSLVRNVLRGIAYMRWRYYRRQPDHPGYIITFCDAVFLTPEAIADTIKDIQENKHDLVLHYVEKETFEKHNIAAKRTYIPVDGKFYTGTSIYYIKKFTNFIKCVHLLGDLRKSRKDPEGLLGVMGLKGCSFKEIQEGLSKRLNRDIGIYISEYPELGMDVDKEADVLVAEEMLRPPWKKIEKIMVIINSHAGRGVYLPPLARKTLRLSAKENISLEETHRRIEASFEACGQTPEIKWTKHAGHATELAVQAAKDNYDVVVAVGGDGTINEVVNGLVETNTSLGVIPVGTANLFATEMGIPANIEAACQVISKGMTRVIDTAKVNDRSFTLMAGIGFDAHVVSKVDSSIKNKWGIFSYPLVAIRELLRYPFMRIKVRTQDGIELQAFYVIVQNSKSYASGFTLSNNSKIDDGSLEVLMFTSRNIINFVLCNFSKNKDKYRLEMKGVKFLEINSSHAIQIDGDYVCNGPAIIKIIPKSLRVLTDSQAG